MCLLRSFQSKYRWRWLASFGWLLLFSLWSGSRPLKVEAWYNSSWTYRKSLAVDATKVSGPSDLTSFPILVSRTDSDLSTHAQSDGDDILFTTSADVKLDHEIESYNSGTGVLVAWVKIPTLLTASNTTIYMYYGNASASNQENPTGVWSNGFQGVWHMAENPSVSTDGDCGGGTKELCDSTSNNNDADSNGSMTSGDLVSNGKISYAEDLDGTDDYFSVADSDSLNIGTGDFSASVWSYTDQWEMNGLISHSDSSDATDGWWWTLNYILGVILVSFDDTDHYTPAYGYAWTEGQWQHYFVVKSGTAVSFYVDGAFDSTDDNGVNVNNSASTFKIGRNNNAYEDVYFDGRMDEMRFANVARSADWIATEYANQTSPGTFFATVGSEETYSGGGADSELSFSISAVGANTVTNAITTSVASSTYALPFSNLTLNTPKYAAHSLYVSTNASGGYLVTAQLLNYMQGLYPGNNIDPFVAPWSNPTTWTEPTGTTPNDNTGWIGANTSDSRVANWQTGTAEKFGGLTSSAVTVMSSSGADAGTTAYVTYAVEVNTYQPSDLYTGSIVYNIVPIY